MSDEEAQRTNGKDAQASASTQVSETPPPPDGGWGWVVVIASFLIHLVVDGLTYSFGIFFDIFLDYFKEELSKTAWITSLLCGLTLLSGPITGSLVNRWGCKVVTVSGALLAAISVTVSAFAGNVVTLIFTMGVGTGLGCGLIYLPAIVSVTVWFERYRSFATGIAVCGSGLGMFIFPLMTTALITSYGWRGAMAIIGALILNCIPLGLMFLPVPEVPKTAVHEPMLPKQEKLSTIKSQSSEHVAAANGHGENADLARLTYSQPALNKSHEHKQPYPRHGSGIMHKSDVLYQGSMLSLTKGRASSAEKYQIATKDNVDEEKCGWMPCSPEFKSALFEMVDLSLLKDPIFILFCFSNFLTNIGFYIPFFYTVTMSKPFLGNEKPKYLISLMGVSTLLGRIGFGFISDKPWVNRLMVYNMCVTIAGLSIALAAICTDFWGFAVYATMYGITSGAYVGLTSVVLVDLFGVEKLTNAFGLLLLIQGTASLIGSPLIGWVTRITDSFGPSFYGAGATVALSGLILFVVPTLQRRRAAGARARTDQ